MKNQSEKASELPQTAEEWRKKPIIFYMDKPLRDYIESLINGLKDPMEVRYDTNR